MLDHIEHLLISSYVVEGVKIVEGESQFLA